MEILLGFVIWLIILFNAPMWGIGIGLFYVVIFFAAKMGKADLKRKQDSLKAQLQKEQENIQVQLKEAVQAIIDKHIVTISLKYNQSTSQDAYGNWIFDKWWQERDYFVNNVIVTDDQVKSILKDKSLPRFLDVNYLVSESIHAYQSHKIKQGQVTDIELLSPIEFEHYCAELLISNGWNARVTKASGDQGVDVIATLNGFKAVLQCKKYSQPVGNAAVQEIFAGKEFEQAHFAAVVSNASFTPSAKQLANSTGVHLLHFSEIPSWAERLSLFNA